MRGTNFVLSLVTLRRSNALSTSTRSLRLVAFRGRSRHTSGFEPYEKFELAPQELIASTSQTNHPAQQDIVRLRQTDGSDVFQWVDSPMDDADLAEAASRCVLLHGLFEVWGHGRNREDAVRDAFKSGHFLQHAGDASWSLGVTCYGRSSLNKSEQQRLAGGSVGTFLSSFLNGPRTESVHSDIRVRIIEDLCPPPAENLPRDVRERAQAATVAGRRREKAFYICRELQLGAAVGVGGTVMATGCGRRPIRGVLGALALNRRKCLGPTAIEPEVALIMANLAKVRSGSRVLDPFCGSCSLLLPAAHMGARTWGSDVSGPATASEETGALVGGDTGGDAGVLQADREGLEQMNQDFQALGVVAPTLVAADVGDEESPVWRTEFYDAIVTDPPYNIKAKVITTSRTTNTSGRHEEADSVLPAARIDSTAHASSDGGSEWKAGGGARAEASAKDLVGKVIWSLLALARSSLRPGGRLCFFLPLRGAEARLDRLPAGLLEKMSQGDLAGGPTRLAVVYTTKQRMTSPNMCRWLVVLEKELDGPARDGEMDQTLG
ncbi:unnamed protein product [Ectocarpus fasciculatus]